MIHRIIVHIYSTMNLEPRIDICAIKVIGGHHDVMKDED